MCGIAGWLTYRDQPEASVLDRMCDVLTHRGPDDRGVYLDGPVGMAMRRLSILDISSGHQPIHNEDQSLWVVFNGEIYNYLELRRELEQKGHQFYTNSDTETIVHLYEDYGDKAPEKLRGMFAFAVWDKNKQSLFLARDRLGIKPLYYYWDGVTFLFGSEIKSLLAYPGITRGVDLPAVALFFTYGYLPHIRTMFPGIQKLLPGTAAILHDGNLRTARYWDLKPSGIRWTSESECVDAFLSLFRDTVKRHLLSDVPIGAFLSGGVDSSLVVAMMSQIMERPVDTFSIGYGFEGAVYDERAYANTVATYCHTNHHEFVVKPDIIDCLPKIIAHYDEPVGDSSAIPNYYLSQCVRQHVTVALSGLGGDELCAGYERYRGALLADSYNLLPVFLRERIIASLVELIPDSKAGHLVPGRAKRFVRSASLSLENRYYHIIAKFNDAERLRLFGPEFHRSVDFPLSGALYHEYWRSTQGSDSLHRLLETDLQTYLVDDLLTLTDRVSMAHSLEVRVPFLDHEVVEFFWRVPSQLKLKRLTTKYLVKKAAERLLPKSVIYRRKQGFSVPLTVWFRGALKDYLEETLGPASLSHIGFFNSQYIQTLLDEHRNAKANHDEKLFALLSFVTWYQMYIR